MFFLSLFIVCRAVTSAQALWGRGGWRGGCCCLLICSLNEDRCQPGKLKLWLWWYIWCDIITCRLFLKLFRVGVNCFSVGAKPHKWLVVGLVKTWTGITCLSSILPWRSTHSFIFVVCHKANDTHVQSHLILLIVTQSLRSFRTESIL